MPFFSTTRAALARLEDQAERALARRGLWLLSMAAITAAVAALRLAVALQHPSGGPDYGHYLIAANWLTGTDRSGEGPFDPPAVPLLLIGLSAFLGKLGAVQALGPLTAAALYPASVYFLARFVPRWAALVGPLPFVLWQQFSEFIAFGGPTNLLALALSLVFYRVFFEALAVPAAGLPLRRVDLAASGLLVAIVATHHLTALVTGSTTIVWLGLRLALDRAARNATAWTGVRIVGVAVVGSLPFVGYLLGIASTDVRGGFGQPVPTEALPDLILLVWSRTPWLWLALFLLAAAAFARFSRASPLLPAAGAILAAPFLLLVTVLASHPVRILYFEQFPVVALAALWSARGPTPEMPRPLPPRVAPVSRAAFLALLLVAVPLLAASAAPQQEAAYEHYHQFIQPGTVDAFEWVAAHTPEDAVIAVDGATSPEFNHQWRGMALGWWLSGYANRRAVYEANPPLLPVGSKWEDARDANRLFAGDTVFEDGVLRVADAGLLDDSGLPRIYLAYYQDYRELVGFEDPRLLNRTSGASTSLVLGASADLVREVAGTTAHVEGNFTGPGFTAKRSFNFSSSDHTVHLRFDASIEAPAQWDAFEITIRLPWWTRVDLTALASGNASVGIPDSFGYALGKGRIVFRGTDLGEGRVVARDAFPFEPAAGLQWNVTGPSVSLEADFELTQVPDGVPPPHPLTMRTTDEILAERSVDFLFIPKEAPADIQRFVRAPARFERAFENSAAVVFQVRSQPA